MLIGERLRGLRLEKKLSQSDIEDRTGLLRPYISRVENGHTVPSLQTLEKMAAALEMPLWRLFYERGGEPESHKRPGPAVSPKDAIQLNKLRALVVRMNQADRRLLLWFAQKMARERKG